MVRRKTSSSSCSCSGLNDVRLRRCDADGAAAPLGGAGGPRPAGGGGAGPGPLPRKPAKVAGAPHSGLGPEGFVGSSVAAGLGGGRSAPPACAGGYTGNTALSPNWSWRDPAAAIATQPQCAAGRGTESRYTDPRAEGGGPGCRRDQRFGQGEARGPSGCEPAPAPPDAGGE